MVTLVTLAATHHSSKYAASARFKDKTARFIPHDANDNRAALTAMTHPAEGAAAHVEDNNDGGGGRGGNRYRARAAGKLGQWESDEADMATYANEAGPYTI